MSLHGVSSIVSPPTAKARDPLPSSQPSFPLEDLTYFNLRNDNAHYDAAITSGGTQTPCAQTPYKSGTRPATGGQTPMTPDGLESNSPPVGIQAASLVPSWSYPKINKWRVLAASAILFGNGLSDAAPGSLLPYMERHYRVGYAVVSLIFVTNAVGFILAAFFTAPTLRRLGRAKSCMAAELLIIAGYIIIACTPPFPAVVVAFFFMGLGMAFTLALNNVFCANLANATVILGLVQGAYGRSMSWTQLEYSLTATRCWWHRRAYSGNLDRDCRHVLVSILPDCSRHSSFLFDLFWMGIQEL